MQKSPQSPKEMNYIDDVIVYDYLADILDEDNHEDLTIDDLKHTAQNLINKTTKMQGVRLTQSPTIPDSPEANKCIFLPSDQIKTREQLLDVLAQIYDVSKYPFKYDVLLLMDHVEQLAENDLNSFFAPNWTRNFSDLALNSLKTYSSHDDITILTDLLKGLKFPLNYFQVRLQFNESFNPGDIKKEHWKALFDCCELNDVFISENLLTACSTEGSAVTVLDGNQEAASGVACWAEDPSEPAATIHDAFCTAAAATHSLRFFKLRRLVFAPEIRRDLFLVYPQLLVSLTVRGAYIHCLRQCRGLENLCSTRTRYAVGAVGGLRALRRLCSTRDSNAGRVAVLSQLLRATHLEYVHIEGGKRMHAGAPLHRNIARLKYVFVRATVLTPLILDVTTEFPADLRVFKNFVGENEVEALIHGPEEKVGKLKRQLEAVEKRIRKWGKYGNDLDLDRE